VLSNLVSNAVVYGSDHVPVKVLLTGTADCVEIGVRNTGPAIAPELLNVIFDPLRRGLHEQNDKIHDYDGLGLYIAREIVKAHGGDRYTAAGATRKRFAKVEANEST
jgi:signal transduction histidine kinase